MSAHIHVHNNAHTCNNIGKHFSGELAYCNSQKVISLTHTHTPIFHTCQVLLPTPTHTLTILEPTHSANQTHTHTVYYTLHTHTRPPTHTNMSSSSFTQSLQDTHTHTLDKVPHTHK